MHDTGSRDDLVSGVAGKVETGRNARDGEVQRPHLDTVQRTVQIVAVKVYVHPAELNELGHFSHSTMAETDHL